MAQTYRLGDRVEILWHVRGKDVWLPGTYVGKGEASVWGAIVHEDPELHRLSVKTDCGKVCPGAHPTCVRPMAVAP